MTTAQTLTSTALVLEEMQLYGYRPQEEPDPRPLPDPVQTITALMGLYSAINDLFADTRLEPDQEEFLWSIVNMFQRKIDRVEKLLDRNEQDQRRSTREQDGSEIKSVELEQLLAIGMTLLESRNAYEEMRDHLCHMFEGETGSIWRPMSGSRTSFSGLTSAIIDSRDFTNARKRAKTEAHLPAGTLIAISGGVDYQNVDVIWSALDKTREKHSDMILAHGGSKGVETIASKWASTRNVAQITFRPDWTRHNKAAPFKRNDEIILAAPKGILIFPGSGITANLADKAKAVGIPVKIYS